MKKEKKYDEKRRGRICIVEETLAMYRSIDNVFEKVVKGMLAVLIMLTLSGGASAVQIVNANYPVVAFVGDAKPALGHDINVLKTDFDQIIPLSPVGYVSATVMVGDMNHISSGSSNTDAAYAASTAGNISAFFVVGNHELENAFDLLAIRSKFNSYAYSPNPGPTGSRETTYSFNVGDMHIIVLNQYWDGGTNGTCDWYVPSGGLNSDDGCMKYSSGDGGFIPDALYSWIENDLNSNTKSWTIVVGHEPLYPWGRHIGDSLDHNTTNRNKLENLFVSKNVTAFIGGHTHVSGIKTVDNAFNANVGVIGDNVGTEPGGDNFSTIIYTYVNTTGHFVIEEKYENKTWDNPGLIRFVKSPTFYSLGDVNKDHSVTVADALLYLRYSVGKNISPFHMDTSDDVTCDNKITVSDSLMVLRKSVGQDVNLGC